MNEPSPSTMLRLMYSSVNVRAFDAQELAALLAHCEVNNPRDEVTGLLLIDGLLNVQYIEGPQEAVRALWERLCADNRHHCIVQLYEEQGDLPRMFGQWAMLKGQASRAEMLSLIRDSYIHSDVNPRPAWSLAIAPLLILLDRQYSTAYAATLPHSTHSTHSTHSPHSPD